MKKLILFISFLFFAMTTLNVHAEGSISSSPVSYSANIVQMMIGLFAIIFMIFSVVWLMKKVGYKSYGTSGMIKIKSCLPISTKEKILLIEVGGEQVLIGTAPGFIGHIKTIENPITEVTLSDSSLSKSPVTSAFADKLKAVLNKKEMIE